MNPSFILTGPNGIILANGVRAKFTKVSDAKDALCSGTSIITGALPFNTNSDAMLHEPDTYRAINYFPYKQSKESPNILSWKLLPISSTYNDRLIDVIRQLRDPKNPLKKVVMAREIQLITNFSWNINSVLSRLANVDPSSSIYAVNSYSKINTYNKKHLLVGASPELLVGRSDGTILCSPFAGSAPRSINPLLDAANASALINCKKNLYEHKLVVDMLSNKLIKLCDSIVVAEKPQLHCTKTLWHLTTPIIGRLRTKKITAIDLALALHPTPAVCGVPNCYASELIKIIEGDRGLYAGTVGWWNNAGDGRWIVSIRCALISLENNTVLINSGCGIVSNSELLVEFEENITKFKTIIAGLGIILDM